jgi:hypothetical protein
LNSEVWENWREGIEQHMARPAFQQAWMMLLPDLDGSFDDFRELLPANLPSTTKRDTFETGSNEPIPEPDRLSKPLRAGSAEPADEP